MSSQNGLFSWGFFLVFALTELQHSLFLVLLFFFFIYIVLFTFFMFLLYSDRIGWTVHTCYVLFCLLSSGRTLFPCPLFLVLCPLFLVLLSFFLFLLLLSLGFFSIHSAHLLWYNLFCSVLSSLSRQNWIHTCAVLTGLDPNSEWAKIKIFLQVSEVQWLMVMWLISSGCPGAGGFLQDDPGSCQGRLRDHDARPGRWDWDGRRWLRDRW